MEFNGSHTVQAQGQEEAQEGLSTGSVLQCVAEQAK